MPRLDAAQLQPDLLRLSPMMYYSPYSCFSFARQTATRDQNAAQFRSLYRGDCPHFSMLHLPPDLQREWAIGEGHETANYGSLVHSLVYPAFCDPSLCGRVFSTRARDSLLAWRRFRRECSLERRTAERGTLCCRSKESFLIPLP